VIIPTSSARIFVYSQKYTTFGPSQLAFLCTSSYSQKQSTSGLVKLGQLVPQSAYKHRSIRSAAALSHSSCKPPRECLSACAGIALACCCSRVLSLLSSAVAELARCWLASPAGLWCRRTYINSIFLSPVQVQLAMSPCTFLSPTTTLFTLPTRSTAYRGSFCYATQIGTDGARQEFTSYS
jgi:hypothetical protein